MVALASAFVRIRPQADKAEFKKTGEQMGAEAGAAAGESYGTGFKRGADGKLRDQNGRFVKDSEAAGTEAGTKAGNAFGGGFSKAGGSKISGFLRENAKLAAGVFVPLGLGAAVAEIGKIGIAYENNLNIFQQVSKATGKQMDEVAAKSRALGADVKLPGVSAAGAAAAMTELAKAGFSVQESMDAAQGTLQLARVAGIDEAKASEIAANAVNAFGIKAKDTTFVVDELAAAANSSSIEVTDASDAFQQAAAVFSGIQGPAVGGKEAITELNTAIAILGNNGIKGSDAGTSLKQALLQLTGPSTNAKNAMKLLALAAGNAKISQDQLNDVLKGGASAQRDALKEIEKANPGLKLQGDIAYDSAGKMRPLRDIIGLTAAGTNSLNQEQKNQALTTIFGSDASRSLFALLKGGVPIYDQQRTAVLQQGAAADFAAAKNKGLGGAIDNVKSQFENASIAVYNAAKGPLTTSLNQLAAILPTVFGYIGDFSRFIHDNIGVLRDWAVAIGVVTTALKINSTVMAVQAAGGVLKYIQGVGIVVKVTQAWTAAQLALDAALAANPIGLVIVAIVALIAGLVLLFRHNKTFHDIVINVWNAIKVAISVTVDWIVNTAWPAIVKAWQAIAAAGMWLWHNVIEPVWHGIQAVISFVVGAIKFYIDLIVAEFRFVAGIAMWLWHNVFAPVFAGINKIAQIFYLAVEIVFKAIANIITFVVGRAVNWLRDVWTTAFNWISDKVRIWWLGVQIIFGYFQKYVLGPVVNTLHAVAAWFGRIFAAIAATISGWWTAHVSPIFAAVRAAWNVVAQWFSYVYTAKIKPVFEAFVGFIRKYVVGGFQTGVDLIKQAWSAVQDAAKKPVSFVVNHVINPFINGLNRAAAVVGVKDRVEPIKGFASGGKISGSGGMTDNRQAWIPGQGAVQLQGGEFVVNREDTAKALPILRWVNAGMKGGMRQIAGYLGKPLTDMPGDGSEGWAFKDGGLVGWVKDVWGAVTNPVDTIKRPFESLLNQIPGSGMIKDFLIGSGKKLLDGAVHWLTGLAGGGGAGTISKAISFLRSQDGKPYIWADAGPDGYDCSGIVSAVYNILHGKGPYNHTFSTESAGQFFPKRGYGGPMVAAWSHPGQRPASASVGHMMGRVGTLTFESSGSRGVHLGRTTRNLSDFANIGHYRDGGLLGQPIQLFDQGGPWRSGTLGANLSGHTEYVDPSGRGGGHRTYEITVNVPPGGVHPVEVGRVTVKAIKAFEDAEGKGWRDG